MVLITNKRIQFDLSDLLPFLTSHATEYNAIDGSYRIFFADRQLIGKKSPPSNIL